MSKCALIGNVFGLQESEDTGALREEISQGLRCLRENLLQMAPDSINNSIACFRAPLRGLGLISCTSQDSVRARRGERDLHPGLLSFAPSGRFCRFAVSKLLVLTQTLKPSGFIRELSARLKSCPDTKRFAYGFSLQAVKPRPDTKRLAYEFLHQALTSRPKKELRHKFDKTMGQGKCPCLKARVIGFLFQGPERPLLPPRIQNRIGLFHSLADQHRRWKTDTKLAAHAWLWCVFALILMLFTIPAGATDAPRSFSLSTSRTFAPGESVKIQLLARNVPELEFRVYKIRDAQKFFAGLKDLHSFGVQSQSPSEQIDQRTLLERLHDFKAHLWWMMRHFFRFQFTDEARDNFREQQGKLGKKSRVVGAAQFAQVPILNASQLVARWKLETPPALVSETQQLPIDGLGAGVYLIEATDGTYKAYTVAMVTKIAMVERIENGQVALYVADRMTGAPVEKADVALWTGGQMQSSGSTDGDGMAALAMGGPAAHPGVEPENVWILARHGDDSALVTPWSYNFGQQDRQQERAYVYTDRPVYRPGHTVHIKGILRKEVKDSLDLPDEHTRTLRVMGPDSKEVFKAEVTVSAHGTVTADVNLGADAALGYYSIEFPGDGVDGSGSFYVEDYKKPEYQVKVTVPGVARVLQGKQIQATIEAKYFFGEPVSGAKVTYVVHTSVHYWWDEDQGDDNGGGDAESDSDDASAPDEADSGFGETEQQEHQGVLDADGRLTINLPTAVDDKREDQDYRIEARVTDAANREVAGHTTVLATYGSFRVSVEPTSYVFQAGQPARVKVTAQDYDGKPVQTQVEVRASLEKWDSVTHERTVTLKANQSATTGADGTAMLDLGMNGQTGDFEVTAIARTPENRSVQGRTWVWIWNGAGQWYTANTQAQIVADKKSYKVGDTAHLLLVTGLKESWAVVTTEGDTVQSRRLMHATGESFAFDVPINQQSQPNLLVNAVIVHDNQVSVAQKSLKVPLVERTLTVTATASKSQYLPGEKGSFDVFVADAQGKPVEADLSFGEVDEALYSVRPDYERRHCECVLSKEIFVS